jgi:iron(III) transport system substrate-binding protein
LFGSIYEHMGAEKTERWLAGLAANLAREPKGGDTDQIRAAASGECSIAITNSYYLARMMRSSKPEDRAAVEKLGVVFPNQQSWGTHMSIAGGAVARHAKNRDNAIKFLEYLASPSAQVYFANGNNEWPAVPGVRASNPALEALGNFKSETIPVAVVGANLPKVQMLLDKVGLK